jgi:outer membrane cobalamin receptor
MPWFNVGYTVLMQGERWSMAQNTPQYRLKPYWEQSITLSRDIQLNKTSLHIQASLQNLTDEQYEIIRYYPMPGRHFVASATMTL